jgi:hypothetical protein
MDYELRKDRNPPERNRLFHQCKRPKGGAGWANTRRRKMSMPRQSALCGGPSVGREPTERICASQMSVYAIADRWVKVYRPREVRGRISGRGLSHHPQVLLLTPLSSSRYPRRQQAILIPASHRVLQFDFNLCRIDCGHVCVCVA